MSDDLAAYYRQRAGEYDEVYTKPERQQDIASLTLRLQQLVQRRSVLELAAGTGFWTEKMAATASRIVATDINAETLAIAKNRDFPHGTVSLETADAFASDRIEGRFDAVVAGFFLSHIDRHRVRRFVTSIASRLERRGRIVLFDNNYVEGSNHPITRRDDHGNTYQDRRLRDGTTFEVLKNFYSETELRTIAAAHSTSARFDNLTYYWLLTFDVT